MPPRQYGNRGSKVTIVFYRDEDGVQVEAWSSSGERTGSHKSAKDRAAELEADPEVYWVDTRTTTIA